MTLNRQLLIFFSIAFAYSWTVEACMIFRHLPIEFSILATFGPTIAALVTHRLAYGNYRAFRLNANWPRTLAAAALGITLVLAGFVIFPALAIADPGKLHWSALSSLSMYNYSTLLGGPLFEEPGWRGFALPRLESRLHPVAATLLLGTLWSAWHVPAFWYPGWTDTPVWIYFLIVTGLSFLMTLGANLARFGVIAPILMHAVFNTQSRYLHGLFATTQPGAGGFLKTVVQWIPAPPGGGSISLSFTSVIVAGAWLTALLAMALTKGRLGYSASSQKL